MTEVKGTRTLSKKKYYELEDRLKQTFGNDEVDTILSTLRDVLKFDPNVPQYDDHRKELIYKRRERLSLQGISLYESSGTKQSYHKRKEMQTTDT